MNTLLLLFLIPTKVQAEKPLSAAQISRKLKHDWEIVQKTGLSKNDSESKEVCRAAYSSFLRWDDASSRFLRGKLRSADSAERRIASAILSNLPQKKESDFRSITREIVMDWRSDTPQRKAGVPAPRPVRIGCQILTRAGYSGPAKAIAEAGAYGYWLHPCISLFLHHGLSEEPVRRSLIFEEYHGPNGGKVASFFEERKEELAVYAQVMKHEKEEQLLREVVKAYLAKEGPLDSTDVNNLYYSCGSIQ